MATPQFCRNPAAPPYTSHANLGDENCGFCGCPPPSRAPVSDDEQPASDDERQPTPPGSGAREGFFIPQSRANTETRKEAKPKARKTPNAAANALKEAEKAKRVRELLANAKSAKKASPEKKDDEVVASPVFTVKCTIDTIDMEDPSDDDEDAVPRYSSRRNEYTWSAQGTVAAMDKALKDAVAEKRGNAFLQYLLNESMTARKRLQKPYHDIHLTKEYSKGQPVKLGDTNLAMADTTLRMMQLFKPKTGLKTPTANVRITHVIHVEPNEHGDLKPGSKNADDGGWVYWHLERSVKKDGGLTFNVDGKKVLAGQSHLLASQLAPEARHLEMDAGPSGSPSSSNSKALASRSRVARTALGSSQDPEPSSPQPQPQQRSSSKRPASRDLQSSPVSQPDDCILLDPNTDSSGDIARAKEATANRAKENSASSTITSAAASAPAPAIRSDSTMPSSSATTTMTTPQSKSKAPSTAASTAANAASQGGLEMLERVAEPVIQPVVQQQKMNQKKKKKVDQPVAVGTRRSERNIKLTEKGRANQKD